MEMPASKSSSQDHGTDRDVRQTGAVARPRSGVAMGQRRSARVTARRQLGRRSGESEMEEEEEGDVVRGSHRGRTVDRGHGGARGGSRGGLSTATRGTSLPMATDEVEVWDPGGQRRGVPERRRGGRLVRGRRRATQAREGVRSRGNNHSPSRGLARSEASVDTGDVPSHTEETEAEETNGESASETEEEHGEEEGGVTEAPRPVRIDTRAIREVEEEGRPQRARERSRIKRSEISERQPSRPSRPKSAFICFLTEFRNRYAESQPKGSRRPRVADVSKAAGEAWKHLTPQEREKYEGISEKSKETYRAERDRLRPPKRIRLEGQPPRPRGAYFHFLSDFRRQYYERNPQEERKPMKVISQLASEEWKRLPEDTKKPYIIEARRDKERYRSWRAKQLERERSPPSTAGDEEERTEASEEIAESGGEALQTRTRSPPAETTVIHAELGSEMGRGSRRREGIEHWEGETRRHLSGGISQRQRVQIAAGGIGRAAVMAQPMETTEERYDASNVLESFLISGREVAHVPEDVRKPFPSDRERALDHGLPQRLEQRLDVHRSGVSRQQGLPPLPPSASRSRVFASQPPTTVSQPSVLVSVGLPSWHVARDELVSLPLGRVSQGEVYGGQISEVFWRQQQQQQQFERGFVSPMEASAPLSRFASRDQAPAGIVTPSTGVVSLAGAASQVPEATGLQVSTAVASMSIYPGLHQMPVYIHTQHWPWQAGGPMPPGSYPQPPPAQTREIAREDSMSARLSRELKAQLESLQSLLRVSHATPDQPHPVPPAMVDSEAAGALLALAGNTPSFQGSIQVSPPRTILPIAMVSEARAREIFPGFEGGEAASFQQAIESTNLGQAGQSALDMAKRQLKAVQELQEVLSAQVDALQKLTSPVERILPSVVTSAGPSDLQAPALAGRLLQRPEESEAAREIRSMALPSGTQEHRNIAYDQFTREQQLERRSVEQDVSRQRLPGGGEAVAPLVLDSYPISRAIVSSGTDFASLDIRNVPTGQLPGTSRGQIQVVGPSIEPLPPPAQTHHHHHQQQQQQHPPASIAEQSTMEPIGVPLESQQWSTLFQSEAFQQSQILIPVIFPSLRGAEETSVYLPIVSGAELMQQSPLVYQVEEAHVVHDAAPAESQATTRPSGDAGGHTHSSGHGGPRRASTSAEPFEGQSQQE